MGVRHMTGTVFHLEKLPNPDGRRHRSRCIYFRKEDNHCCYRFSVCIGSAHCPNYKEKDLCSIKKGNDYEKICSNQSSVKNQSEEREINASPYVMGAYVQHRGLGPIHSYGCGYITIVSAQTIQVTFDSGMVKDFQLCNCASFLSIVKAPQRENKRYQIQKDNAKTSNYVTTERIESISKRYIFDHLLENRGGVSVTKRIGQIQQPRGGYLPPRSFQRNQLDDGIILCEEENIASSIVGTAVDYLVRFMIEKNARSAFSISLRGAAYIGEVDKAERILQNIKGTDNHSIIAACQLCGYDVCVRATCDAYRPVENIVPNLDTISNIRIMVNRTLFFLKKYGPITMSNFTFQGGYTDIVSSGDGDFCTQDTMWDMKVLKKHIMTKHTLQILMYYIMSQHSIFEDFKGIKRLGFYNPRLNIVYTLDVDTIPREVIKCVETDVIGYLDDNDYDGEEDCSDAQEAVSFRENDLNLDENVQNIEKENLHPDASVSTPDEAESKFEMISFSDLPSFWMKNRAWVYRLLLGFWILLIVIIWGYYITWL